MRVLVTGATGFIGNYVVSELMKRGIDVITSSSDEEKAKKFEWYEKTKYIPYNFNEASSDKKNLFQYFGKPDFLINLAWEGLPNYNELFHIEKNLFNHYFFLKNMISNGLKGLCNIGTCFEYGKQNGELSENSPSEPSTVYGCAKDTLRKLLEWLKLKHDFQFKWIRLFYLYGLNQSKNSILSKVEFAISNGEKVFNMSGGEQLRDYLEIEKAAEYIVTIMLNNEIDGIINCCSGKPISIRSLVENYLKTRKSDLKLNLGYYPYLDYEPMAFWGSSVKLNKIIGDLK